MSLTLFGQFLRYLVSFLTNSPKNLVILASLASVFFVGRDSLSPQLFQNIHCPSSLSNQKQLFVAIHTSDVHNLRGSDAHATTGASVLATTGLSGSHTTKSRNTIVSACASDLETAELVPIDQNVSQIVLQNEL
jgi:hypothetical protein